MSRAKTIAAAVVLVALGAVGYGYYMQSTHGTPGFADRSTRHITLGTTTVEAEVVSTDASRQQGLSGRQSLPPGTGMLFVFESDGMWGIWMKDMNFPIDIVYLDRVGAITTIYGSVLPDTYPEVFYPAGPARYVLELPAGFAEVHGLAVGQTIVL